MINEKCNEKGITLKHIQAVNHPKMTTHNMVICLLVFASASLCSSRKIENSTGIIWQIKPYYWIDEKNQSKGIIAEAFATIQSGCVIADKTTTFHNLQPTVMLDSLEEFYNLFRDVKNQKYGKGKLANITSYSATWLPVIQEFNKSMSELRNMTEKTLFVEPDTAVLVHRSKISLFHKLQLGILQTRHILVLSFLSAIIFAILVWFAERWNNKEFAKSFTFGFGTGLWWAFVTMTTVGYGDVVPRSFIGRFLTIIWMILGLAAASLMTAAVSDVVLGVAYIDLSKYSVATIKDSFESNAIIRDYNSSIVACDSYQQIIDKVSNGEAEAGVLPSYIAGSMMEDYYKKDLRVPFQLKLDIPVKMLYNPKMYEDETLYVECVQTYFEIVFNMFVRKYKVYVQEETLYVETIPDFYKSSDLIKYFTICIGILIGAGLLYDGICTFFISKKGGNMKKRPLAFIIKNEAYEAQNKGDNTWRNEELNKMREDIMGIKESLMKINTLAKYKNPWY